MAAIDQSPIHQDGVRESLLHHVRREVIECQCGRVVWHLYGQGVPLVLLNGGHGSWLHWARNIHALGATRLVFVPDMPGYGESDSPHSLDLSELLNGLNGSLDMLLGSSTRIALTGFSFGGLVAAHLAASRETVERLALLGPAGHGGRRRPRADLFNWRIAARPGDGVALRNAIRHNLLAHMLHAEESVDEWALQIHTEACIRTRYRSKAISRSDGLQALLPASGRNVMQIWGEHDVTATPDEIVNEILATHPHTRAVIVPGAGHWVQYEAAQTINTLLSEWLTAPLCD